MSRVVYSFCQAAAFLALTPYVRVRHFNVPDVGRLGGVLIASNHQSFLDPPLIGMALPEPVHYLARADLFEAPLLGRLLRAVNVHPIRRGQADVDALRTTIRILRAGRPLVLFPEGTRTPDGRLGRFRPGVGSLALRCGVPLLPVCIEGAFECWPRWRRLPSPGRVAVLYGDLIRPHGRSAHELAEALRQSIAEMQVGLREHLGRGTI